MLRATSHAAATVAWIPWGARIARRPTGDFQRTAWIPVQNRVSRVMQHAVRCTLTYCVPIVCDSLRPVLHVLVNVTMGHG